MNSFFRLEIHFFQARNLFTEKILPSLLCNFPKVQNHVPKTYVYITLQTYCDLIHTKLYNSEVTWSLVRSKKDIFLTSSVTLFKIYLVCSQLKDYWIRVDREDQINPFSSLPTLNILFVDTQRLKMSYYICHETCMPYFA